MRISILGSGTGVPTPGYGPACFAVSEGTGLLFVDCGSGALQKAARLGIEYRRIETVLLTHAHADHTLDLVSLLHALNFTPGYVHEAPLLVIGPPGFKTFLDRLIAAFPSLGRRSYPLSVTEAGDRALVDRGWVRIAAAAVPHGSEAANAYRLETAEGIVAFSGDCSPSDALVDLARGADMVVAEASFVHGSPESEPHMTAGEAGHLAQTAGVETLVLAHFYPGASEAEIRAACAREFRGTIILARDEMRLEIVGGSVSTRTAVLD